VTQKPLSLIKLLQIRLMFIKLGWEIDEAYSRFCNTFSFLTDKQQLMILELTNNYLKVNCKIRSMPHSDSGVCRTVIPEHAAH
jgi:hypothetical protein